MLFMNVQNLNSDWTNEKISNQKLNKIIINDFCDSFTAEIRYTVMNNKIKIICMKKKFIKIITYHDTEIFKNTNWEIISEILKIIIKNVIMQTKKIK